MPKSNVPRFIFCTLVTFLVSVGCSSGAGPNTEIKNTPAATEPTPSPVMPPPLAPPIEPALPPLPSGNLGQENIGNKVRVNDLFDRWTIKSSVSGDRGTTYAEVTTECRGKIETELALTSEQWRDNTLRAKYYNDVNALVEKNGLQLLADKGNPLQGQEQQIFIRALKALAWQESHWQHYLRYKNWFFILLSGGSYNVLDDWGITQVARSGFKASALLNPDFFKRGDHCSLSHSLYYGFTEYLQNYLEARSLNCNKTGNELDKILGAYNRYSSGYSACYNGFSNDSAYRNYQTGAMNGLKSHYLATPWQNAMESY